LFTSARRLLGTVSAGCALSAAIFLIPSISAAQAAPLGFGSCTAGPLSQPFTPWGDSSSYELAPGGDFESSDYASSPWTLTGGARLATGSEPYAATGTLGSTSLALPAGSSAQSPTACVGVAYPTVRFFVGGTGTVAVNVVAGGLTIPTGVVVAAGSWMPSPVMVTLNPILAVLADGSAQVSLEFTGLTGSPQVDDVFIDPWTRG
jgi:hypothetical protein